MIPFSPIVKNYVKDIPEGDGAFFTTLYAKGKSCHHLKNRQMRQVKVSTRSAEKSKDMYFIK